MLFPERIVRSSRAGSRVAVHFSWRERPFFPVFRLYAKLRYYDDRSVTPFLPDLDSCLEEHARIMSCFVRNYKPKLIVASMKGVDRVIKPAHSRANYNSWMRHCLWQDSFYVEECETERYRYLSKQIARGILSFKLPFVLLATLLRRKNVELLVENVVRSLRCLFSYIEKSSWCLCLCRKYRVFKWQTLRDI